MLQWCYQQAAQSELGQVAQATKKRKKSIKKKFKKKVPSSVKTFTPVFSTKVRWTASLQEKDEGAQVKMECTFGRQRLGMHIVSMSI